MTQSLDRLLVRRDFLRVAKGLRRGTHGLVLQLSDNPDPDQHHKIRYGLTATRKIGGAVIRNRARRRLRALAHEILPKLGRQGMDYVLIARLESNNRNFADLRQDLSYALRKLHSEWDEKLQMLQAENN